VECGRILEQSYPRLHSFAINDNICLNSVFNQDSLHDLFQVPLSEEAFIQFCELDIFLHPLRDNANPDTWSYIWGSKIFSSQKAYKHLIGNNRVHPAFKWVWRSSCQQKHKLFFLASPEKQTKHKRFIKKKKYGSELL
jgi:hypothetical protein